jgi:hypothetical protein
MREILKEVMHKDNRVELKRAGRQLIILLAVQFIGFFTAWEIVKYIIING